MGKNDHQKPSTPALERALDILELLALQKKPLDTYEIATELKIPQASAFRLVKTLINRGYLQKDSVGKINLGGRHTILSHAFYHSLELLKISQKPMINLHNETFFSVELCYYLNDEIIYLDVIEAEEKAPYHREKGTILLSTANPSTLLILAFITSEKRKTLMERIKHLRQTLKLKPDYLKTSYYLPNIDETILHQIKQQKFIIDFGFHSPEIGRCTCPIFDQNQNIIGTIGVSHFKDAIKNTNHEKLIQKVQLAADQIQSNLPY